MTDAVRRDGWARLGPFLSDDAVDTLRRELDDALGPSPAENAYGVLRHNLWTKLPGFEALVRDGRLARAAMDAGGFDALVLFQDNLIWKPPGTAHRVEWHQDYAYWPLDRPLGVTLWLALDDASVGNGCLHYVSGSHLRGERRPTDFVAGATQELRPDLPPLDASDDEGVAVPVRAGELLAHDPLTWHMSPGNASAMHRRAWSLTFVAPEVRWATWHSPHPYRWELGPTDGEAVVGERFPRFGRGA